MVGGSGISYWAHGDDVEGWLAVTTIGKRKVFNAIFRETVVSQLSQWIGVR